MFALMPCSRITMNADSTAIGVTITTIRPDRMWNRNTKHTSATTMNSSSNLRFRLSSARPISAERSYVVTISTPAGRLPFSSSSFAVTRSMVARALSPLRITMTPPTASPWPSSSPMPRRISGPRRTSATSRSSTGVPCFVDITGICSRSAMLRMYPVARTMYSASAISTTEPPTSWLPSRIAFSIIISDRP